MDIAVSQTCLKCDNLYFDELFVIFSRDLPKKRHDSYINEGNTMTFFKSLATAAVVAIGATSAHATTFRITDAINSNGPNGFGSSGFHDQVNNPMSGAYFTKFKVGTVTGAYDDAIVGPANIYFSGDLEDGGSFTARGFLSNLTSRVDGLFGDIVFKINGSAEAGLNGQQTFSFSDDDHNTEANGLFNATSGLIMSLWGDNSIFRDQNPGLNAGLDMRLQLEEGGDFNDPEPVPLPATALLLVGALGGLGGMRKLRKKS